MNRMGALDGAIGGGGAGCIGCWKGRAHQVGAGCIWRVHWEGGIGFVICCADRQVQRVECIRFRSLIRILIHVEGTCCSPLAHKGACRAPVGVAFSSASAFSALLRSATSLPAISVAVAQQLICNPDPCSLTATSAEAFWNSGRWAAAGGAGRTATRRADGADEARAEAHRRINAGAAGATGEQGKG